MSSPEITSPYIGIEEAMVYYRCCRSSIRNYILRGILPKPIAIGAKKYWTRDQIAQADENLRSAA
ncbi:hypothetical protein [Bradyrhizobium sp. HKCCYLS20291]|uniref:hypothetical protein n=1 Tax=Bradyrhizobium sp. HKCCYLS20291 TaxID=3420766 RepID=UPI003EBBAB95